MPHFEYTRIQTNALLLAAVVTLLAGLAIWVGQYPLAAGLGGALAASLDKFTEVSNGHTSH